MKLSDWPEHGLNHRREFRVLFTPVFPGMGSPTWGGATPLERRLSGGGSRSLESLGLMVPTSDPRFNGASRDLAPVLCPETKCHL